DQLSETIPVEVVNHVEHSEAAAAFQLVADEIHAPALAGSCWQRQRLASPLVLPAPAPADLQAFLAVYPVAALAVDNQSLAAQLLVQEEVAPARVLRCQLPHAIAELCVVGPPRDVVH